ncbi:MAG: hypothetical protein H6577_07920 [Lewinellaceae bacterium]|nr:hypothetical protein [Saprospiraceae bacterium]MCB9338041.1 hypothetical protein [Lewinellaceae bacterium]
MTSFANICKSLLLVAIPFVSFGQNYWEGALSLGYTNYLGDMVAPIYTFKEAHPGAQLSLKKYFDGRHALRANFMYGSISGDDKNFERLASRGVSFKANLFEITLMGEMDLYGTKRFSKNRGYNKTMSPYIFVGLGATFATPEVVYGDPENADAKIDYPGIHMILPIGGGVKIDLKERVFVGAELGVRLTASDNLDGVQASGNAYKNDVYLLAGLTAGYRFIKRKAEIIEEADLNMMIQESSLSAEKKGDSDKKEDNDNKEN